MQPSGAMRDLLSHSQLESDAFKIYCYKIVPCAKKFGHDWSECPFAHEGEKATRRCPALYLYSSIVCPDVRQSKPCPRGDVCPYSHSIFEYWMHPARFRAQMCSFGAECNRRICFFAHAQDQLRVPSEPVIADALASRAPYLQGRVCPKSRYALYPEQVPPAILLSEVLPQQTLLHPDLAGAQGMSQMLVMPAPDAAHGAMAVAAGPSGAVGSLQPQPWQQGRNVMFVPAGQAPGGAGLGYYVAAAPTGAAAAGGMPAAGMVQQQYSAAMVLPPGGLQMGGPTGGGYSSSQPVQLVAMGPDGNLTQYPMAAGGIAGGTAFAPAVYSPSGPAALSMPMQPAWGMQQGPMQPGRQHLQQPGPQQGQQQLQLVQVGKAGEGLGQAGTQEGFLLPQPSSVGQSQPIMGGGYAVPEPGGTSVVNAPVVPSPSGGGPVDAGPARVDDLAQQMGGWRIS